MDQILLFAHLGTAGLTGLAAIAALYVLTRGQKDRIRSMFMVIAWLACTDIVSGSLLAISRHQTALAYCRNIAIYLAILAAIESMLWMKIRHQKGKTLLPVIKQTVFVSVVAIVLTFVSLV